MEIPVLSSQKDYLAPSANLLENWTFAPAPVNRFVSEWRAELELVAQQIAIMAYANKHETVYLVCDKSYESQILIQSFQWVQANIVAIIPRFSNNDNSQLVAALTHFCEENRVPYTFCDIDARTFLGSDQATNLAQKIHTHNVGTLISTLVWHTLASQNKFLVFPMGLPRLVRNEMGWHIEVSTSDFGLMRTQGISREAYKNNPGVPLFFKWSPEVINAYLNDAVIREIVTNQRGVGGLDDTLQHEIFSRYYKLVGSKNYTGLEKMPHELKTFRNQLKGKIFYKSTLITYADYMQTIKFKQPPPQAPVPPPNQKV